MKYIFFPLKVIYAFHQYSQIRSSTALFFRPELFNQSIYPKY